MMQMSEQFASLIDFQNEFSAVKEQTTITVYSIKDRREEEKQGKGRSEAMESGDQQPRR